MKIIDLDDESTWSEELLIILKNRAFQLKSERDAELKADADGSRWFNPLKTPITDQTIEEIIHIITSFEIRAYHCTRLLEPKKVLTTGLKMLTPKFHKEILAEAMELAKCTNAETKLVFELLEDFQRKGYYKNREGMIWFVLSKKMAKYSDCAVFFQQVGGEVTERALGVTGSSVLSKLSFVGKPVLVECILPIKNAAHFQIDNLAKTFIQYGIKRFAEKSNFIFYCEMFVKYGVSKEAIQSIWELNSLS